MRLNKFSTQLLFGLTLVVCVTGILMFFHIKNHAIEVVHELIGLAFAAAIILHLLNHSKPTVSYFKKMLAPALLAVALLVSAALYGYATFAAEGKGSNIVRTVVTRALEVPLTVSAPLFSLTTDSAISKLRENGLSAVSDQSINVIAQENGTMADKIVEVLVR